VCKIVWELIKGKGKIERRNRREGRARREDV